MRASQASWGASGTANPPPGPARDGPRGPLSTLLAPRRGATYQPRAQPWDREAHNPPEALKGRDITDGHVPPFQGGRMGGTVSQGCALGWYVRAFQAIDRSARRCLFQACQANHAMGFSCTARHPDECPRPEPSPLTLNRRDSP